MSKYIARPVEVEGKRILDIVSDTAESKPHVKRRLTLTLEDGSPFVATTEMLSRFPNPGPGDYVVTRADGYVYLNPKDVFERKYGPANHDDDPIEQDIQSKGLTAARVTPADIEASIAGEFTTTADKAFSGCPTLPGMELLTICVLVLKNGFTVTGESACASPENFDADIGRKIARQNAVNKVWPLEGYLLKSQLHAGQATSDGQ